MTVVGVSVSCMQNMSTFEIELESLLGEFHIKMKGELRVMLSQHMMSLVKNIDMSYT
jgi:hypothetical protein